MFAHRCYCPVWVFERLRPSRWSGQVPVKPMGGFNPAGVTRISRPSVGEVHVLLSIDLSVRL